MRRDWQAAGAETVLRVDGGMVASDWTMQFLADILDAPVDRPKILETTAVGAAYLAGLDAGLYPPPDEFAKSWQRERRFKPNMRDAERDEDLRRLAARGGADAGAHERGALVDLIVKEQQIQGFRAAIRSAGSARGCTLSSTAPAIRSAGASGPPMPGHIARPRGSLRTFACRCRWGLITRRSAEPRWRVRDHLPGELFAGSVDR